MLELDAVLAEPGKQVTAAGLGEAASGEPVVAGDLGGCRRGQGEGLCCLVGGELGLRQDQAVQWRLEDVNGQWRDTEPGLAQQVGWERGEQLVFGYGQVGVGNQTADVARLPGGDLLGEFELGAVRVKGVFDQAT